ncbi:hypothetical protein Prudu_021314 [Prunus dulcis]|uniref:Uncharacterized protein n=1 Tax=Prunus dulcis TaxID=3755 RepID=A0A4Y1RYR5_PRUDU|nr:hypothetical protein Prudu_021314 [Prunus dulcis]
MTLQFWLMQADMTRSKFRFGIQTGPCACPTPGECRAQMTYLPFYAKHNKITRLTSTEKPAEFPLKGEENGKTARWWIPVHVSVTQSQPEPQTGRIQWTVVSLIRFPGSHGSGVAETHGQMSSALTKLKATWMSVDIVISKATYTEGNQFL